MLLLLPRALAWLLASHTNEALHEQAALGEYGVSAGSATGQPCAPSPGRQFALNTPPAQLIKRKVSDEHTGLNGIDARMLVALNEQVAVLAEENLFAASATSAKRSALELACTRPPGRQYGTYTPEKQSQKQNAPDEDLLLKQRSLDEGLVATTATKASATPGVVSSVVPPVLGTASGTVSAVAWKHSFDFTPLPGGIFTRSSCSPSETFSVTARLPPLMVEQDPIDDFDGEDFHWEYDGFETVQEEVPLALTPPPPVLVDIWPQVRRHIDDHHARERVAGDFPSAVFSRTDHFRLWLKETFTGLNEVTFQLALDYLKMILERHCKELQAKTPPSESWCSGGRSSTHGKPSRRPKGR